MILTDAFGTTILIVPAIVLLIFLVIASRHGRKKLEDNLKR